MQTPNGAVCEVQGIVGKKGERRVGTCVPVVVIRNFRRTLAVRLQGGSKCEVHVGNRMESGYLEHRALGLHRGTGDQTGRGG